MKCHFSEADDKYLAEVGRWVADGNGNFDPETVMEVFATQGKKMYITYRKNEEPDQPVEVQLIRVFDYFGGGINLSVDEKVVVNSKNLVPMIAKLVQRAIQMAK